MIPRQGFKNTPLILEVNVSESIELILFNCQSQIMRELRCAGLWRLSENGHEVPPHFLMGRGYKFNVRNFTCLVEAVSEKQCAIFPVVHDMLYEILCKASVYASPLLGVNMRATELVKGKRTYNLLPDFNTDNVDMGQISEHMCADTCCTQHLIIRHTYTYHNLDTFDCEAAVRQQSRAWLGEVISLA